MSKIGDIYNTLLNSGIIEAAQGKRLNSFTRLAAILGMTNEELVTVFLPAMKKSVRDLLAFYEVDDIDPAHKKMLLSIRDPDNYWEYVGKQEEYKKAKNIDEFFDNYGNKFLMNRNYLERIGAKMPTPIPKIENRQDLEYILFQIPVVFSYDLDFNAFLSPVGIIEGVPYIGINEILYTVLDVFTVQVASMIFGIDDKVFRLKNIQTIFDLSEQPANVACLLSCIHMLSGRSPQIIRVNMDPATSGKIYHATVPIAANFVVFHEFGHLLLGHLEMERDKSQEFQADAFAMTYIEKKLEGQPKGAKFLPLLSLACLYMLLYCSESVMKPEAPYYPKVFDRIQFLLKHTSDENKSCFALMWNNIIYAINHSIGRTYNLSFMLFE